MASLLSPLSVLPTFVGGRPLPSGKAKLRVQRQPGIRIPVPVKKGKRATVAAKSSEEGPSSSSSPDYYELLQVPRDADAAEIKANYRRFMKLYHPDRGWPADDGRSRTLVEAYRTLSDRRLREAYDKKLRHHRTAFGSMMWGGGGLVGPIPVREVVKTGRVEASCLSDTQPYTQYSELIHWVRQWGQTFLFSAELPLPLPIQCDDVEGGARMAFMGFKNKRLQAVGEMVITVEPDMRDTPAREEDGDAVDELQGMTCDVAPARWLVQVSRWHEQPGKLIPGEARVLKAFENAMKKFERQGVTFGGDARGRRASDGTDEERKFGIQGVLAAVYAGCMGFNPLFGALGDSYETDAYHLRPRKVGQNSAQFDN